MTTIHTPTLSSEIDVGDLSSCNILILAAGTAAAPTTVAASGKGLTVVFALPASDGGGGFFALDPNFVFGNVVRIRPWVGYVPAVQDELGNSLNWTDMVKFNSTAPHWVRSA